MHIKHIDDSIESLGITESKYHKANSNSDNESRMRFKQRKITVFMKFRVLGIIAIIGAGLFLSNFYMNRNSLIRLGKWNIRLYPHWQGTTDELCKQRTGGQDCGHAPIDSIFEMADGFEPDIVRDFPSVKGTKRRIPRIMHQMWISDTWNSDKNENIIHVPMQFQNPVKSFFRRHRQADWTYMFWTREKARELIKEKHAWFLAVFDSYKGNIMKSDALRYVIIYEYGGVYADLDITFLRPLNRITVKYPCVLTLEPYEHPVFNDGQPFRLNGNLIFCRPRHPFMKFLIDRLPYGRMMVSNIDIAGPSYLTMCYLLYSNISKDEIFHAGRKEYQDGVEPFFYKGRPPVKEEDSLYIANSQYVTQPVPKSRSEICTNVTTFSLIERMCAYLKKRNFVRPIHHFTFTKHTWAHTNVKPERFNETVSLNKTLLWS